MKRAILITIITLAVIFAVIQIFQTDHSNPPVTSDFDAPPEVKAVLRQSCYDCHSNETNWPWYSYVNPMGWILAGDVQEGRAHLNFSIWEQYDAHKRYNLQKDILEEIESGEMPLSSYLLMHESAELSTQDRAVLRNWISQ